jgi:hypothetical protein
MKVLVISNFFPPHVIGGAEIIAHHRPGPRGQRP